MTICGIRKCSNCGKDVVLIHKHRLYSKNVFCNRQCESQYAKKKVVLNAECPICHKKFHRKNYQVAKYKNNYCSVKCLNEAKKIYFKGEGNHQYGLKGSLNATWKSDIRLSNYGYILVRCLNHPFKRDGDFVLQHRLVAEKYLLTSENSVIVNGKRYLRPDYDVHHKDFNKTNNTVENLIVLTKSQHMSLHSKIKQSKKGLEMIKFEKVDFAEFKKSCKDNIPDISEQEIKESYDNIVIPTRATKCSAGYDIVSPVKLSIKAGKEIVIPTGLKVCMNENNFLMIVPRSSYGFKYGMRLVNTVAIGDSDYFCNESNDGHYLIKIKTDKDFIINAGDKFCQGIFLKFDTVTDEELVITKRKGGFGSTGKK